MILQTVLFNKKYWNVTNSRKWLRQHGHVYNSKVDTTANYHRFRQVTPKRGKNYYTVSLPNGIELVYMEN